MNRRLRPLRESVPELQTPANYERWSADEKLRWLWATVIQGTAHEPTALPALRLPFQSQPLAELAVVLRRAELDKALSRTSDLMEPGRPKVIHALGAVATVELVTDAASPFTGLLAPPPAGGAVGVLRMSLVARVGPRASYTPGLGLKLLVDGHRSADVLAMNHTVGQGRDFDLFSNTMTNDLSDGHQELPVPQRIMSVLFHRVSHHPRRLSSAHLADRRRDGSSEAEPLAPDRLVFRPTAAAARIFQGQHGVDFRRVLAGVPAGVELYGIVGMSGGDHHRIGTLRTTSTFVSSDGGDRLFFHHAQDDGDRILGPLRN